MECCGNLSEIFPIRTGALGLNSEFPPESGNSTCKINDRVFLNTPDMQSLRHVQTLPQGS